MFYFLFYLLLLLLRFLSVDSSMEVIKVRENINLTITCQLNFTKIPVRSQAENIILWYKDESQVIGVNSISNNPKNYLLNQVNFDTFQLIILNVQLASSGLYKCQSFTGKEEHHYQVHVLGREKKCLQEKTHLLIDFDCLSCTFACSSRSICTIACN